MRGYPCFKVLLLLSITTENLDYESSSSDLFTIDDSDDFIPPTSNSSENDIDTSHKRTILKALGLV